MLAACLLKVIVILGADKYAVASFYFDHCLSPQHTYVCLPKGYNERTKQMILTCENANGEVVFDGIVQIEGPHI